MKLPPRLAKTLPQLAAITAALVAVLLGALVGWRTAMQPARPSEAALDALETRDGRLVWKGTTRRFDGRLVSHDADGRLRTASEVRDGQLHGLSEGWHTNGVLQIREPFVRGVADGVRTKWREDGTRESEASVRNGKIDGRFVRWNAAGTRTEEAYFQAGVPSGEARAWHPDGSLSSWCRLEQGRVVESKSWPPGECREWPATIAKAP